MFSLVLVLAISRLPGRRGAREVLAPDERVRVRHVGAGFGLPVVITREVGPGAARRRALVRQRGRRCRARSPLPLLAAALRRLRRVGRGRHMALALGADGAHRAAVGRHAVRRGGAAGLRARARFRRDQPRRDRGARGARAPCWCCQWLRGRLDRRSCCSRLRVAAAVVFVLTLRRRGVHVATVSTARLSAGSPATCR